MCEKYPDDSTARTDYWETTDRKAVVFKIDDGEQHWYIAENMAAAIALHFSLDQNEDGNDMTISEEPGEKRLTRNEYGGPVDEKYPPCFERKEEADYDPTIASTAAEWAAFYEAKAPVQLMSSVF